MQSLKQDDDVIIDTWRHEILSNPNAYIISRVGEVESKPNFGPFDDRLKHPQIQEDMILIAAHAIADATTVIAFKDNKVELLNRQIAYYKKMQKSVLENKEDNEDDKIKKITAIDIFIIMLKDLKRRLQASKRCVRASDCPAFAPYEKLGGSKRKTKQRKIKKTMKSRKSMTLKKRALK